MNIKQKLATFKDEGHYIDRAYRLAKLLECKNEEKLLKAFQEYWEVSHKPPGIDIFLNDFSELALAICRSSGAKNKDLKNIAWTLEYDVLERHNLIKLRLSNETTKKEKPNEKQS